jgi:ferric-dicitrate binding protein FerR (iron transport regulator)/aminoglycoside phosphotransferase (APT) family kinase protein
MTEAPSSQGDRWVERLRKALSNLDSPATLPDAVPTPPTMAGTTAWLASIPSLARYEIGERLGEGATAVVYRAQDRELRRPVAIKLLKEIVGASDVARQRFRREAQAAAGLAHPNIIQVHDVAEEQGRLYLVMELVDGKALSELLRSRALQERDVVRTLEKAARGVAAAHASGVVHRDLKPANILVGRNGEPKVADFGLAHLLDAPTELTRSGMPLGTPQYMSPEQAQGRVKDITPRTDVYALGAILYEALTGRPVHSGETTLELFQQIVRDDPAPVRTIRADAPRDLETIAMKALRREPSARYANAEEFADDLARYLAGEPIHARPLNGVERLWRWGVRRRAGLVPAALSLTLAAALLVLWLRPPGAPAVLVATVESVAGKPTVRAGSDPVELTPGNRLFPGQRVRTEAADKVVLRFSDGTSVSLSPRSKVELLSSAAERGVSVETGAVTVARPTAKGAFVVDAPHGSARLPAGTLDVGVADRITRFETIEGESVVRAKGGTDAPLRRGFFIVYGDGQDGVPRTMTAGLMGQWFPAKLDGRIVRDSSGHGWDGVYLNKPAAVEGRRGKAAGFDGQVQLDVTGLGGSGFPRSGTLSFWMRVDVETGPPRAIFDTFDSTRRHLFIRTLGEGQMGLQVAFQDKETEYPFFRNTAIPKGQWTHVALVWDVPARIASVYLNGVLDHRGTITDPKWAPIDQIFSVGGGKTSGIGFIGQLDDVRLYARALPEEEIRVLIVD